MVEVTNRNLLKKVTEEKEKGQQLLSNKALRRKWLLKKMIMKQLAIKIVVIVNHR